MGLRSGAVLGTLHTRGTLLAEQEREKERGKRKTERVDRREREIYHQAHILCDEYYELQIPYLHIAANTRDSNRTLEDDVRALVHMQILFFLLADRGGKKGRLINVLLY